MLVGTVIAQKNVNGEDFYTGGYCSYPSDKITVNWVSPAEETVKIDLR